MNNRVFSKKPQTTVIRLTDWQTSKCNCTPCACTNRMLSTSFSRNQNCHNALNITRNHFVCQWIVWLVSTRYWTYNNYTLCNTLSIIEKNRLTLRTKGIEKWVKKTPSGYQRKILPLPSVKEVSSSHAMCLQQCTLWWRMDSNMCIQLSGERFQSAGEGWK